MSNMAGESEESSEEDAIPHVHAPEPRAENTKSISTTAIVYKLLVPCGLRPMLLLSQ